MNQATQTNPIGAYLSTVEAAVKYLGFTHISPEALMALGDELANHRGDTCCGNWYADLAYAYRKVMAGFSALLAPVEAA